MRINFAPKHYIGKKEEEEEERGGKKLCCTYFSFSFAFYLCFSIWGRNS